MKASRGRSGRERRRHGGEPDNGAAISDRHSCSVQLAFGSPGIDAGRIEFRSLMQKTFLRRNRNHHRPSTSRIGCELQIPVAQRQPLSLEGANRKVRSFQEVEYRFGSPELVRDVASPSMRTAVPCLHVQRGHMP